MTSPLTTARRLRDLSQVELAARAGVHPSKVSEWESGRATPSTPSVVRLARALGVDVDYLLGLTSAPRPDDDLGCELIASLAGMADADRKLVAAFAEMLRAARVPKPTLVDRIRERQRSR